MNANEDTQILYLAYHRRRYHYFSITPSKSEAQGTLMSTSSEDEIEKKEVKKTKKKKVIKKFKESNSQKETKMSTSKILKTTKNQNTDNKMEIEVPIAERRIVKVKSKPQSSISQIQNNDRKKQINFKDIFLLENKELRLVCGT